MKFAIGSLVRHVKSGGVYRVIGHCLLERDQTPAVIYASQLDGKVWVRDQQEFDDGRFVSEPDTLNLTQATEEAGEAFTDGYFSAISEHTDQADRYLWLREQDWFSGKVAVVLNPKTALKLGQQCLSRSELDQYIDSQRKAGK